MTYHKAFEKYWAYVDVPRIDGFPWMHSRIKRVAYNAWKAGRRLEHE